MKENRLYSKGGRIYDEKKKPVSPKIKEKIIERKIKVKIIEKKVKITEII